MTDLTSNQSQAQSPEAVLRKVQHTSQISHATSFITAIVVGLLGGGAILWISGFDPLLAYRSLFGGAFQDLYGLGETLISTTPLLLSGLAVAVAFQGSLFNIGVEGQLMIGALLASVAGHVFKGISPALHLGVVFLFGIFGGALWAALPGYLRAKRGAHEVITTIMMNYIAFGLTEYLVNPKGPFAASELVAASPVIEKSAYLPRWLEGTRMNAGIIIALFVAFLLWILIWHTRLGYRIRVVGKNPDAARFAGISVPRNYLVCMLISGGVAGLAGAIEISGIHHRIFAAFSPGYGFDGIAIALVGQLHPLGISAAALLFGALHSGSVLMQEQAQIPVDVISIISATITCVIAIGPEFNPLYGVIRRLKLEKIKWKTLKSMR